MYVLQLRAIILNNNIKMLLVSFVRHNTRGVWKLLQFYIIELQKFSNTPRNIFQETFVEDWTELN